MKVGKALALSLLVAALATAIPFIALEALGEGLYTWLSTFGVFLLLRVLSPALQSRFGRGLAELSGLLIARVAAAAKVARLAIEGTYTLPHYDEEAVLRMLRSAYGGEIFISGLEVRGEFVRGGATINLKGYLERPDEDDADAPASDDVFRKLQLSLSYPSVSSREMIRNQFDLISIWNDGAHVLRNRFRARDSPPSLRIDVKWKRAETEIRQALEKFRSSEPDAHISIHSGGLVVSGRLAPPALKDARDLIVLFGAG